MALETNFIDIDPERLDEEWQRQPRLVKKYREKLAEAKKHVAETKAAQELVEAQLSLAIRRKPEDFDLEKVTEGVIEACIKTQDEFQEVQAAHIEARYDVDVIEAAVHALDHKKRGLSDHVALHGQDYFSEPRAPKGEANRVIDMKVRAATKKKGKSRRDDDDGDE